MEQDSNGVTGPPPRSWILDACEKLSIFLDPCWAQSVPPWLVTIKEPIWCKKDILDTAWHQGSHLTVFGLFPTSQDMSLLSLSPKKISMFNVLPVSRKWAFSSEGCVSLCRNYNYTRRRGIHCLIPSAHAGCWEVLGLDCGALWSMQCG